MANSSKYSHLQSKIIEMFLAGESIHSISRQLGPGREYIAKVLRDSGIREYVHKPHNTTIHVPIEELKRLNESGLTSRDIAKRYGVSQAAIAARFKRNGISPINWLKKNNLTKDLILRFIDQGLTAEQIAEKSNLSTAHLWKIAKQLDLTGALKNAILSHRYVDIEQQVIQAYEEEQRSQRYLAETFSLNRATIRRILERHSLDIRDRNRAAASRVLHEENDGSDADSIARALAGSGRFKDLRPCLFYIYGLTRYPKLSKLGITFDIARRIDNEYGSQHLLIEFLNRVEAFFFERAVSYHTRENKFCPPDLARWGGYSEIRNIQPRDLVMYAESLYLEFRSQGLWEFVLNQRIRMRPELWAEVRRRAGIG